MSASPPTASQDASSSHSALETPFLDPGGRAHWIILAAVLALSALFRLPWLGSVPNGLFLDEASRGYDAYALLRTGADQYGVRWPLFAEGLDDYTPTLYTLLAIPSIAALGLTETAVRLPAALVGILTVLTVWLCGRQLLGPTPALVGAALVAVSPWHILPSRTGAEWALLPCFMTAGLWLLLRGRQDGRALALAGAVFGVGLYSYAFARLLVPLLVLGFAVLWWRDLRRHWPWALAGALILAACAVPLIQFGLTPAGQARLQTVVPLDRYRGLALIPYALGNFAAYFGPGFLVWGSEPTHHHRLAGFGPVLWVMVPLALVGLYPCVRHPSRGRLLLLWWILAAPASAALHRESPSSALMLGGVGSWQLLAGLGAWQLLAFTPRVARQRTAIVAALALGYAVTALLVARALFLEYPRYAAEDWLAGSREVVTFLERRAPGYDGILVSDRLPTPHVLVLFFAQVDPFTYQPTALHVRQPNVRSRGDLGAYHFGRTGELLERPGRFLVWLPADEARSLFRDRQPLFSSPMPDGHPWQQVYEIERR
ncbi:MAG: glycosyltransferase family 39 protein [Chloroflexi bacterium]|nr:glycosyltransferase family 39 protein [Chloroflexota bacterium]